MKLLIAAIYTNYTTTIVDDSGITQEDSYIAYPSGYHLVIKLEKV